MPELSASTRFLRGAQATDAGISRGVALPCSSRGYASYVLTMLSGKQTSVVPRIERWVVDSASQCMQRVGGYCETQGALQGQAESVLLAQWPGDLAASLLSGRPLLLADLSTSPAPVRLAAQASQTSSAVFVPVLVEDKAAELAVLYL